MALEDRTAQQHLTPEARRELLRAFADRMLLKVSNMDDPEDLPGVERAVRVAAMIERVYSRCDRAERQKPDPRKAEAERAANEGEAIKARVSLANTLKWSDERRRDLGQWWEAARSVIKATDETADRPQNPTTPEKPTALPPNKSPSLPPVTYTDLTADIEAARAELALRKRAAAQSAQHPDRGGHSPPSRSG